MIANVQVGLDFSWHYNSFPDSIYQFPWRKWQLWRVEPVSSPPCWVPFPPQTPHSQGSVPSSARNSQPEAVNSKKLLFLLQLSQIRDPFQWNTRKYSGNGMGQTSHVDMLKLSLDHRKQVYFSYSHPLGMIFCLLHGHGLCYSVKLCSVPYHSSTGINNS